MAGIASVVQAAALSGGWFRAGLMLLALLLAIPAPGESKAESKGEKQGGILRVFHRDSPGNMSIHELGTISTIMPMMGVFNNLVLYDQHVPQNSLSSIVPDLATAWKWNEDGTKLTFTLRQGVTWHDGKPFTAADVKCTWDLLTGQSKDAFKINSRKGWYTNLSEVTVNGAQEAVFHLKRPQPALLALLASGFAPVYPCHVSQRDMRIAPVGTGPFKFVAFNVNQNIKVTRNPHYWKPGKPLLDGIEYTIIPNRSTAILAFVAGRFDMTFPFEVSVPLLKDVKTQMPDANCEITPTNTAPNVLMNPVPPFDDLDMRRAVAMSFDRRAFIDILTEGAGDIGTAMLPGPEGQWAMPEEMRRDLPGYDPDIGKSREKARAIMKAHGYGPENRLKVKLSTRNLAVYRDPAVILISQLKEIYIDGELDPVETALWVPKLIRRDYQMALSIVGNGVDDADQGFPENYVCGSRTYMDYCNPEIDRLIAAQSAEADQEKRKKIIWEIDQRLQRDAVRPIVFYYRSGTCLRPEVKGLTIMRNSTYNGWRMEDVWLDR